jgi:hypothetical protein
LVGSDDAGERGVNLVELGEELFKDLAAIPGKFVEAFLAVVLFAPLALEKALGLKATEKGVERAFVDLDAQSREVLAQGVAIMLPAELSEDGDDEETAAQLQPEIIEEIGVRFGRHYQV